MSKSIFIFRRDLRLEDNTGLLKALKESEKVIPCFIFDPRQTENNSYFSKNAFQFMIESLKDLDKQLNNHNAGLNLFEGKPINVIDSIKEKIGKVYVNKDYTPFSKKRDNKIKEKCKSENIKFDSSSDLLLTEPGDILTNKGEPYKVFTYFYKKCKKKNNVEKPVENNHENYASVSSDKKIENFPSIEENDRLAVNGGRSKAKGILDDIEEYDDYNERQDTLTKKTTRLSAHNKFGTYSVREIYHIIKEKLGEEHDIIRQLYWRDFFTHIAHFFPKVFGDNFREEFDAIEWKNNDEKFRAWRNGETGFPVVDAGMRQLNKTGYMHNRARMIVASFLTKDLHIDWRKGEKYFAKKLVDYDPSVNNGNWQWAASTGCDAQPYFRIFNPWTQQEKHDPKCEYIKKWVPELRELSEEVIHDWKNNSNRLEDYPKPIVKHDEERKKALEIYKKIKD